MVTAEMAEKACRARISAQWGRPVEDHEWAAVRSGVEEKWMAEALAAVLPEIQAQGFDTAAAKVRGDWAPHRCPWVGFLDDEAARLRAEVELPDTYEDQGLVWTRPATTTEGTTT